MCLQLNRGRHQFESNAETQLNAPGFAEVSSFHLTSFFWTQFFNAVLKRKKTQEDSSLVSFRFRTALRFLWGSSEGWEIYFDEKVNEVVLFSQSLRMKIILKKC